jgi:hypothetical protein
MEYTKRFFLEMITLDIHKIYRIKDDTQTQVYEMRHREIYLRNLKNENT